MSKLTYWMLFLFTGADLCIGGLIIGGAEIPRWYGVLLIVQIPAWVWAAWIYSKHVDGK